MLLFNLFYNDLSMFVLFLCSFIPVWVFFVLGWQLVVIVDDASSCRDEDNFVEFCWTFVPSVFVCFLCYLNLRCLSDHSFRGVYDVVKVVGHQWYWSYEVGERSYDSLILDYIDSVDKPLRLVYKVPCSLLVTSADVIHSFSLPSFGLKVDAVPGRINQLVFCPDRLGVFVGYCMELCGVGHAYMPIVLEVVKVRSV